MLIYVAFLSATRYRGYGCFFAAMVRYPSDCSNQHNVK